MNKYKTIFLTYQKDYSEKGSDRYFIYDGAKFYETQSTDLFITNCYIVTHDYWLISSSLYKQHGKLPDNIIDIVLLSKITAGTKSNEGEAQIWDISTTIKPLYKDQDDFDKYINMYYRRRDLSLDVYMLFSHKLAEYFQILYIQATKAQELERFYSLEIPIFNILTLSSCRGVRVDNLTIRDHKSNLKMDFYRQLKLFAEKHDVLYEVPSDGYIRDKVAKIGYQVNDYSIDFILDFLPSADGYTEDLRQLQKTQKSHHVFNSISSSASRIKPIVDTHATTTSRIYNKSPTLQNIKKKFRDIFIPDENMSLCYIDYDQFEVGIMAAISSDQFMKEIYENSDIYNELALVAFNNANMRKKAKIMFLSYTYGMSLDNILHSVSELNGDVTQTRSFFAKFSRFESW